MPYVSARQRAYMHIHHPEIARRWDKKYGGKITGKKKRKRRRRRKTKTRTKSKRRRRK